MLKRTGLANRMRFKQIELRIGNRDSTGKPAEPLTENPLVVTLGDTNPNDATHIFELAPPVGGKFLTLQIMHLEHLEVDEVNVNIAI